MDLESKLFLKNYTNPSQVDNAHWYEVRRSHIGAAATAR